MQVVDGAFHNVDEPALSTINLRLRDDYIRDCEKGLSRWNKVIADMGIDFELTLPHQAFNREIGQFAGSRVSPAGEIVTEDDWEKGIPKWLPTADDGAFITELMQPEFERGTYASWIAPPRIQIDSRPGDFEYVKIA
ncbi:MAG: hypothetical protein IIB67_11380 [Proteobacteria bacterium]|nr:hypothetical protein [Pseudomonadota bacterium]